MAAGRIRLLNGYAKLERLAIRRKWRGAGAGNVLIRFMLDTARANGMTQFVVHAQIRAEGFYKGHGFITEGGCFMEADTEHCRMIRRDGNDSPS